MTGRDSGRKAPALERLLLAPYTAWASLFILVPLAFIAYYAFTDNNFNFTLDNVLKFFTATSQVTNEAGQTQEVFTYLLIVWRSLKLAIISTIICLLIGYPMAYIMARASSRVQKTMVTLIMIPMWMNFLIRTYAWMTILQDTGIFNGLLDLINDKLEEGAGLYPVIHYKDNTLEFAFCHTPDTGEKYYSFVNGQYTSDGGTHLSAFKGAITRAVNEHFNKNFDAKDLRDGIIGSVAVKIQEPLFESQTKNKLGNTDVKYWIENTVKTALIDWMLKHPEDANLLLEKVVRNQEIRKEIQKVQKKGKGKFPEDS